MLKTAWMRRTRFAQPLRVFKALVGAPGDTALTARSVVAHYMRRAALRRQRVVRRQDKAVTRTRTMLHSAAILAAHASAEPNVKASLRVELPPLTTPDAADAVELHAAHALQMVKVIAAADVPHPVQPKRAAGCADPPKVRLLVQGDTQYSVCLARRSCTCHKNSAACVHLVYAESLLRSLYAKEFPSCPADLPFLRFLRRPALRPAADAVHGTLAPLPLETAVATMEHPAGVDMRRFAARGRPAAPGESLGVTHNAARGQFRVTDAGTYVPAHFVRVGPHNNREFVKHRSTAPAGELEAQPVAVLPAASLPATLAPSAPSVVQPAPAASVAARTSALAYWDMEDDGAGASAAASSASVSVSVAGPAATARMALVGGKRKRGVGALQTVAAGTTPGSAASAQRDAAESARLVCSSRGRRPRASGGSTASAADGILAAVHRSVSPTAAAAGAGGSDSVSGNGDGVAGLAPPSATACERSDAMPQPRHASHQQSRGVLLPGAPAQGVMAQLTSGHELPNGARWIGGAPAPGSATPYVRTGARGSSRRKAALSASTAHATGLAVAPAPAGGELGGLEVLASVAGTMG